MATPYIEYPISGKLGEGKVMLLDAEDYHIVEGKAVALSHGYAVMRPRNPGTREWVRPLRIHREVMELEVFDERVVDHINHNRLDNRKSNLRVGTVKMNNANVKSRRGPYSKGAYRLPKGNWKAQVNYSGKDVHLGVFTTQRAAWWAAEQWRRENIKHYIPQDS
jgi:hypothetical protein